MKTNVRNELTIDNMINLLNEQNYTIEKLNNHHPDDPNRFKISDFNNVAMIMVNYFFKNYTDVEVQPLDKEMFLGGYIGINEKMKLKWMKDISYIEFESLYPNIIIKLWKENKLKFSIYEFGLIYTFLVQNKKLGFKNPNIKEESKLLWKIMINYLYGASNNPYRRNEIVVDNVKTIPSYTRETFQKLFENHSDNVAYIDTDQIFLDFVSPEIIINYINPLGLPYTIEHNKDCMFIEKKRYMMDEFGTLKVRGVSEWRTKFKKEKLRIKKINKIVSLIRNNENHEIPSST